MSDTNDLENLGIPEDVLDEFDELDGEIFSPRTLPTSSTGSPSSTQSSRESERPKLPSYHSSESTIPTGSLFSASSGTSGSSDEEDSQETSDEQQEPIKRFEPVPASSEFSDNSDSELDRWNIQVDVGKGETSKKTHTMDTNEKRIGIWGVSGSGKTTYLAMLSHAIDEAGKLSLDHADEQSKEFVQSSTHQLLKLGFFPPPTELARDNIRIYRFRLFRKSYLHIFKELLGFRVSFSENDRVLLEMIDAAGAWFEYNRYRKLRVQFPDAADFIDNYLRSCQGLIVLYDPADKMPTIASDTEGGNEVSEATSGSPIDLLNMLIDLPKEDDSPYIPQSLAICITKVDGFNRWDNKGNPKHLAKEALPENVISRLKRVCRPGYYEFFAVSAIGVARDNGQDVPNIEPNDDPLTQKEHPYKLRSTNVKPYGLLKPLNWLLDKI